jgi:hypothetical protein
MKVKILIFGLSMMLNLGCSMFGISNVEEASYDVMLKDHKIEIRNYKSYLVAKTTISGDFKKAQSQGFRILASYIFGKNKAQQKIKMTAPVSQKVESKNEEISMTAPVLMAKANNNSWTMTFTMPAKYNLETLPKPDDPRVEIETVPSKLVAAYTFTGLWSSKKNKKIEGLNLVSKELVFHAGTNLENGQVLSNGGRVLAVTSFGTDFQEAIKKSYQNINKLHFDTMYFRKDIGFDL